MIRNRLKKCYTGLYTALFLWILLQACLVAKQEMGWKLLPFLIVFIAAVCFFARFLLSLPLEDRLCRRIWACLQAGSAILMCYMIWRLEMKLHWDWQEIIQGAYQLATDGKLNDHCYRYFARYPNNQFWLTCMAVYFKVLHVLFPAQEIRFMKLASMALVGLSSQLSLWMIWSCARMWMKEKEALLVGLLVICFLPFYLYAGYSYTDTPGMFLTTLLVWLFSLMVKGSFGDRGKRVLCILSGFAAAVCIRVKITGFIFVIAVIIEQLLEERFTRKNWRQALLQTGLIGLCLTAGLGLTGALVRHTVQIDEDTRNRYEFPLPHWIMMGLYDQGGYTHDMFNYTVEFPTIEEKREADLEKIRELAGDMGPSGLAEHLLVTKLRFTWTKDMLRGDWFCCKYPVVESWLWHHIALEGICPHKIHYYTWSYWLFLLAGLCLSGVFGLTEKKPSLTIAAVGRLSLLGTFLFLTLWEANARYLLPMLPLLFLTAAHGWIRLLQHWPVRSYKRLSH